ncbi:MAG TPA: exodeoxyribonuclease VII large subunit, partial [Coriobacteriia bacterium]
LTATAAQRLDLASSALARALPQRLTRERERTASAADALPRAAARSAARHREHASLLAARLEDLSPLGILGRGYAVCYDESGTHVVRSARELNPGDLVRVRLHEGIAGCRVEDVEREGPDG